MYSKQIVKNCANASFIRKMFEKGLMLVSQMFARRWQHFIAHVLKSQSLLAILS